MKTKYATAAGVAAILILAMVSLTFGDPVDTDIANLTDKNWKVRRNAAGNLGNSKDPRAVGSLIGALSDDSLAVRRAAVASLSRIGKLAVTPLIHALQREKVLAQKQAARFDRRFGPTGQGACTISAERERLWDYIEGTPSWALARIRDKRSLPPLTIGLKDGNWIVRATAASAVGLLRDPETGRQLIPLLNDENCFVRMTATAALGIVGDRKAAPALANALKDDDPMVRVTAARALRKLKDPETIPPLVKALEDESWRVRRAACLALGAIKDPRATEPVLAALNDTTWQVRSGAAHALGQIGDERAVKPLLKAVTDESADVRGQAAVALGYVKAPRAVQPLIAALKDKSPRVRSGAAYALGRIGDSRALEPLIATLKDDNSFVRSHAAEALAPIKDPRAVDPLIAALKDPNGRVRENAAAALGNQGDRRALKPLSDNLTDWYSAQAVARSLTKLGWKPQSEKERILYLAGLRKGAELRRNWPAAKKVLLTDLRSADTRRVRFAFLSLIGIGQKDVIDVLIQRLDSSKDPFLVGLAWVANQKELRSALKERARKHVLTIPKTCGLPRVRWGAFP